MEFLSDLQVDISEPEVLRYLGYQRRAAQPQAEVKEILEVALERGYQLAQPKAVYTWVKVEEMNEGWLTLEGGLRLSIGSGLSSWKGAEYLAVALCTIGSELENEVSELFAQGDFTLALVLDSVGSVAIESVADHVNYLICQRADLLGVREGPRLSPGYGQWELPDQRVLFTILPGEKIGVQLNEHCIMIPQKSISFAAGVGKDMDSDRGLNPCQRCGLEGCQYRVHSFGPKKGE